jgi:hypothetical protein
MDSVGEKWRAPIDFPSLAKRGQGRFNSRSRFPIPPLPGLYTLFQRGEKKSLFSRGGS